MSLGEFNVRHKLHDYWEDIQRSNRFAHFLEEIVKRGATYELDHSNLDSELRQFIKENQEEITNYFRSPKAFNDYQKLADATEGIYDI